MQPTLENSEHATLNVCQCGKLHFRYGPLTLHFELHEFMAFANDVGQLACQLQQAQRQQQNVPFQNHAGSTCH